MVGMPLCFISPKFLVVLFRNFRPDHISLRCAKREDIYRLVVFRQAQFLMKKEPFARITESIISDSPETILSVPFRLLCRYKAADDMPMDLFFPVFRQVQAFCQFQCFFINSLPLFRGDMGGHHNSNMNSHCLRFVNGMIVFCHSRNQASLSSRLNSANHSRTVCSSSFVPQLTGCKTYRVE